MKITISPKAVKDSRWTLTSPKEQYDKIRKDINRNFEDLEKGQINEKLFTKRANDLFDQLSELDRFLKEPNLW